jgi:hypothetical protein
MKDWWLAYLRLPWDKRVLWSAAALALVPVALSFVHASEGREAAPSKAAAVDTYIPKGFVLVPIEVRNYEALDSILGSFGIVDLYQAQSADSTKLRLAARNVRLMRAPQNPQHFAVLIEETRASGVLRDGGLFTVIVKRPGGGGTEFVEETTHPHRSITYDGG